MKNSPYENRVRTVLTGQVVCDNIGSVFHKESKQGRTSWPALQPENHRRVRWIYLRGRRTGDHTGH